MLSGMNSGDEQPTARDVFGKASERAEAMLMRGLLDAQRILSGPVIQARCLECPGSSVPLRKAEQASLSGWLAGLLAR